MRDDVYKQVRKGIGGSEPIPADKILDLVESLPANPIIVEVGTWFGGTAREIALTREDATVYCVDQHISNEWRSNIKEVNVEDRVHGIQGISWDSAHLVPDNVDMVFIDADHEYVSVVKDIIAWKDKVKIGGIISGDDIGMDGVDRAVKELMPNAIKFHRIWWLIKS